MEAQDAASGGSDSMDCAEEEAAAANVTAAAGADPGRDVPGTSGDPAAAMQDLNVGEGGAAVSTVSPAAVTAAGGGDTGGGGGPPSQGAPSSDARQPGPAQAAQRTKERIFMEAVDQLGGAFKAKPKEIMALMMVPELSLNHIKSHLQKQRTMEAAAARQQELRKQHEQQQAEQPGVAPVAHVEMGGSSLLSGLQDQLQSSHGEAAGAAPLYGGSSQWSPEPKRARLEGPLQQLEPTITVSPLRIVTSCPEAGSLPPLAPLSGSAAAAAERPQDAAALLRPSPSPAAAPAGMSAAGEGAMARQQQQQQQQARDAQRATASPHPGQQQGRQGSPAQQLPSWPVWGVLGLLQQQGQQGQQQQMQHQQHQIQQQQHQLQHLQEQQQELQQQLQRQQQGAGAGVGVPQEDLLMAINRLLSVLQQGQGQPAAAHLPGAAPDGGSAWDQTGMLPLASYSLAAGVQGGGPAPVLPLQGALVAAGMARQGPPQPYIHAGGQHYHQQQQQPRQLQQQQERQPAGSQGQGHGQGGRLTPQGPPAEFAPGNLYVGPAVQRYFQLQGPFPQQQQQQQQQGAGEHERHQQQEQQEQQREQQREQGQRQDWEVEVGRLQAEREARYAEEPALRAASGSVQQPHPPPQPPLQRLPRPPLQQGPQGQFVAGGQPEPHEGGPPSGEARAQAAAVKEEEAAAPEPPQRQRQQLPQQVQQRLMWQPSMEPSEQGESEQSPFRNLVSLAGAAGQATPSSAGLVPVAAQQALQEQLQQLASMLMVVQQASAAGGGAAGGGAGPAMAAVEHVVAAALAEDAGRIEAGARAVMQMLGQHLNIVEGLRRDLRSQLEMHCQLEAQLQEQPDLLAQQPQAPLFVAPPGSPLAPADAPGAAGPAGQGEAAAQGTDTPRTSAEGGDEAGGAAAGGEGAPGAAGAEPGVGQGMPAAPGEGEGPMEQQPGMEPAASEAARSSQPAAAVAASEGQTPAAKSRKRGAEEEAMPTKERVQWTPELHEQFVAACDKLGGPHKAKPSEILAIMRVPGLGLNHVKSHLQKYRLTGGGPSSARPPTNTSTLVPLHPPIAAPPLMRGFVAHGTAGEVGSTGAGEGLDTRRGNPGWELPLSYAAPEPAGLLMPGHQGPPVAPALVSTGSGGGSGDAFGGPGRAPAMAGTYGGRGGGFGAMQPFAGGQQPFLGLGAGASAGGHPSGAWGMPGSAFQAPAGQGWSPLALPPGWQTWQSLMSASTQHHAGSAFSPSWAVPPAQPQPLGPSQAAALGQPPAAHHPRTQEQAQQQLERQQGPAAAGAPQGAIWGRGEGAAPGGTPPVSLGPVKHGVSNPGANWAQEIAQLLSTLQAATATLQPWAGQPPVPAPASTPGSAELGGSQGAPATSYSGSREDEVVASASALLPQMARLQGTAQLAEQLLQQQLKVAMTLKDGLQHLLRQHIQAEEELLASLEEHHKAAQALQSSQLGPALASLASATAAAAAATATARPGALRREAQPRGPDAAAGFGPTERQTVSPRSKETKVATGGADTMADQPAGQAARQQQQPQEQQRQQHGPAAAALQQAASVLNALHMAGTSPAALRGGNVVGSGLPAAQTPLNEQQRLQQQAQAGGGDPAAGAGFPALPELLQALSVLLRASNAGMLAGAQAPS
ncbi:hypothetical protein N2152v2_003770 [Parachlorella kessleri]